MAVAREVSSALTATVLAEVPCPVTVVVLEPTTFQVEHTTPRAGPEHLKVVTVRVLPTTPAAPAVVVVQALPVALPTVAMEQR